MYTVSVRKSRANLKLCRFPREVRAGFVRRMGVMRVEKSAESDLRYSVTGSMRCECIELESRPSRARGLKLFYAAAHARERVSRPSRARGLKRRSRLRGRAQAGSRPSRARGLKRVLQAAPRRVDASRPSRARGLKQLHFKKSHEPHQVAPLAGAWVETAPELLITLNN